jgi:hemerythrin-like domain-containing protein
MDPLETLSNEHGLIRQYLDNLALAGERIENGQYPSTAFFEKALEFARGFSDKFHHFKEEHVLFVRLAEKKKGEIDAQLETLRNQHERGRELVAGVGHALDGYAARDPNQVALLLEQMAGYRALMRHHIHTEDHVFYPMARKELTPEELDQLSAEFEKQRQKYGGDCFERNHKIVVDMGSILKHLR